MRLPTEAGDRPIVSADVHIAAEMRIRVTRDAKLRPLRSVSAHIRQDRRVGDRLDQSRTKHRRRDPKNDVWISALPSQQIPCRQKIGLGDIAAGGVPAAGDDEHGMHFAIGRSVQLRLKRASRMGPFAVMNHGTEFLAPSSVATGISGFRAGRSRPQLAEHGRKSIG